MEFRLYLGDCWEVVVWLDIGRFFMFRGIKVMGEVFGWSLLRVFFEGLGGL